MFVSGKWPRIRLYVYTLRWVSYSILLYSILLTHMMNWGGMRCERVYVSVCVCVESVYVENLCMCTC